MRDLQKLLFRAGAPAGLPDDVRASLEAWRNSPPPDLSDLHFHTRYVVVDIVSSGLDPDKDSLLGIAASSIWQGAIQPDDSFYVDFSSRDGEGAAVDAPDGTAARPITPDSSRTSASTVGLPRESRISRAMMSTMALMVRPFFVGI